MLAALAGIVFVAFLASQVLRPATRLAWGPPALASIVFLGFSTYAIATEGPMGFWTEHIRNAWGNQIWFDLLFAASVGWTALLPRARAAGMRPWAWALALPLAGSVALLAMLARVLYLEGRSSVTVRGSRAPSRSSPLAHEEICS
jgi:hypothetical protein